MSRPTGARGRLLTADEAAAKVGEVRSLVWAADVSYPRALIDTWVRRGRLAPVGQADDGVRRFVEAHVLRAERLTRGRAFVAWSRVQSRPAVVSG